MSPPRITFQRDGRTYWLVLLSDDLGDMSKPPGDGDYLDSYSWAEPTLDDIHRAERILRPDGAPAGGSTCPHQRTQTFPYPDGAGRRECLDCGTTVAVWAGGRGGSGAAVVRHTPGAADPAKRLANAFGALMGVEVPTEEIAHPEAEPPKTEGG